MEEFKEGNKVQFRTNEEVSNEEMRDYDFTRVVFSVHGGKKGTILGLKDNLVAILTEKDETLYLHQKNAPFIVKNINYFLPQELFEV